MLYRTLADITVALHLLWILFLIFGWLPGLWVKWIRVVHLASLGFSIILQLNEWICPLTHLEIWLRGKAGWTYSGSFIRHYVEKLVYLEVPRQAVFAVTLAVVAVSLWLYISRTLKERTARAAK